MTSDTLLGILMLSLIIFPIACMVFAEYRKARRLARIKKNRRNYWEATRHHQFIAL